MINAGRFQPDLRRIRRINEYGIFFEKGFSIEKYRQYRVYKTDGIPDRIRSEYRPVFK